MLVLLAMVAHESSFVDLAKSKCNKAWPRGKIAHFRKLVVSSKLDKALATTGRNFFTLRYTMECVQMRYRSSGIQWKRHLIGCSDTAIGWLRLLAGVGAYDPPLPMRAQ